MSKNFGKKISKNLSSKYSQNILDHAKNFATDALSKQSQQSHSKPSRGN